MLFDNEYATASTIYSAIYIHLYTYTCIYKSIWTKEHQIAL